MVKTHAQRQREYRERKKIEKQLKKIPLTNAEHQQQYRQNQTNLPLSEEAILARKRNDAERAKRYRDRLKLLKQNSKLVSSKEDSLPNVLIEIKEEIDRPCYTNSEEFILSRHQMQTNQPSIYNEAQQVISPDFQSFQAPYGHDELLISKGLLRHETNIVNDGSDMSLKEEMDEEIKIEPMDTAIKNDDIDTNQAIDIKIESDVPEGESSCPFEHIRIEIKQEIPQNDDSNLKTNIYPSIQEIDEISTNENKPTNPESDEIDVKEEMAESHLDCNDASIDSDEATALGNVEACLQGELNIKDENYGCYNEPQSVKDEINNDLKIESDITVTETHLISNKVINTTSTITNPLEGLIQSQTTTTLVMQIHPITQGDCTMATPEEILPTTADLKDECHKYGQPDYDDTFQLNSITGDVLSLEQEAYGLLKSKDSVDFKYSCTKCVKELNSKRSLQRHLKIHETIERRAKGIIQGQKTKFENKKKKLADDDKRVKEEAKKEGYECVCGKVFQRKSRLETCLRSHNMFSESDLCYSCAACNKQFKTKDELTLHRKRLHSKKKFPCKFCPTDYNTRKELIKHLQIHQKVQLMEYKVISEFVKGKQKLKCFMCSKTWSELSDLKSHIMDQHKEPYLCPHCKNTFPKIIDFANHTKTYHPEVEGQSVLNVLEAFSKLVKAWKCEECELQFHEADKLALHQLEQHSRDVKGESQFQCIDCRRVFISQKGLTSHRRIHHNTESAEETELVEGVMCLECRKMCKDMTSLASHMRFHSPDRKYVCKFCDFRFATSEKRKAHAEIHTGDMKFVCFICEYQCSSENRLKCHKSSLKHLNMKEYLLTGKPLIESEDKSKVGKIKDALKEKEWSIKRKNEKDKKISDSSSSESEVTCDICGEVFTSESVMVEHKQTHPYIEFPNDDQCSRIFFK